MEELSPPTVEEADPADERVKTRANGLPEEEEVLAEAAENSAATVLAESDRRTEDPATRDLSLDTVERRKVEDLVPPEEDG